MNPMFKAANPLLATIIRLYLDLEVISNPYPSSLSKIEQLKLLVGYEFFEWHVKIPNSDWN